MVLTLLTTQFTPKSTNTLKLPNLSSVEDFVLGQHSFSPYSEVMLAGGEPWMYPEDVDFVISTIRKNSPTTKVTMLTSWRGSWSPCNLLEKIDGVHYTVTDEPELLDFRCLDYILSMIKLREGFDRKVTLKNKIKLPSTLLCKWTVVPTPTPVLLRKLPYVKNIVTDHLRY